LKYDLIRNAGVGNVATATAVSHTVSAVGSSNTQAQVLSDCSYVVMDAPKFFPNIKISKLRMRYAQVLGRLMVLGISFLPHHQIHSEEMAVQLFLLSVSMKPIVRSIQLYQCITASDSSSLGSCSEECILDLEVLESTLTIDTNNNVDNIIVHS